MTTITIEFPEGVFSALRRTPKDFATELRLAAAVFWYQRGEVSQGKAAEIAGLGRVEFIRALSRLGVDAIQVDVDDLREELSRG
jgi:predicted HTH domain antitoxin